MKGEHHDLMGISRLSTDARQRRSSEIRAFLRSRRARVTPADVGMPAGEGRRTPGLRREEVLDTAADRLGSERVLPVRADVSIDADLDLLVRRVETWRGALDTVFANAGVADFRP